MTMIQTDHSKNNKKRGAINDFSVDSRLRVAACFRNFEPRALACSVWTQSSSGHFSNRCTAKSVCALSGPKGIICFPSHSPQTPYLIIHHISPSTRNFSLAFQPTSYSTTTIDNSGMQHDQSPFLLAAAAGSGVLIYDVSGHALSPLITRLNITADYSFQSSANANHPAVISSNRNRAMSFSPSIGLLGPKSTRKRSIHHPHHHNRTPTSMNMTDSSSSSLAGNIPSLWSSSATMGDTSLISNEHTFDDHNVTPPNMVCFDEVTSICWKPTRQPLLVTTSNRDVSLWDLRAAPSTSVSSDSVLSVGVSRPTIRLASLSSSDSAEITKFVHGSCSRTQPHQVAIINVSGIVQIYDDRMVSDNVRYHNNSRQSHPSLLQTFQAHTVQGVGIESYSDLSSETYWITWGRDRESHHKISNNSCTAKIWQVTGDMESSSETAVPPPSSSNHSPGPPSHSLLSTLPDPIHCVRVCPWPYKATFMTVGPVTNDNASTEWRADFWEIAAKPSLESTNLSLPEVVRITSFEGEGHSVCGNLVSQSIGADNHIHCLNDINNTHYLVAAELSISNSLDSGCELDISCLSSTGYLTTYSVPEASSFKMVPFQPTGSSRNTPCEKINMAHQQVVSQSKPTVFLQSPLQEKSSHDTDDDDELRIDNVTRKLSDSSILTEKIIKSFTKGENSLRPASTLPSPDLRPLDVANDFMPFFELESAIERSVVAPANGSAFTLPSSEAPRTAVFNASLAGRIPCPRLCGASFSPGGTSLVVFSNGGVCKIWEWFNKEANNVSRRSNFVSDTKRGAPKTYLDLIEMNETSKIAQWGDEEDNINRPDCNDSTSSATSSSSDGDQYLNEGEDFFRQSLYDDDLKKADPLRPVSFSRKDSSTSSIASSKRNPDQFVVPNSDPLATQVFVTEKKDVLALHDQCSKLAQRLQLGDWVSLSYDEARCIIICQQNADACYELKMKEKGDVWKLLSQVIENHVLSSSDDDMLLKGDALGRELVTNLLDFYEKHGDVQMLATMVCVLSRKQRLREVSTCDSCSDDGMPCDRMTNCNFKSRNPCVCNSLLPCDGKRYGTYINMYGDLLYGWGMLTQRTELMKHLVYFVPSVRGKNNGTASTEMPDCGESQGIGVAPLCPRCLASANPLNNVCPNCQCYAFHCTICANSVRGLFTSCFTCGHGGHFEHMIDWFADNTVCPSGCGCTCVFNTYSSQ